MLVGTMKGAFVFRGRGRACGVSWKDVANGVPSDLGFAMAAHPHDPDCVYIVPLQSDT